MCVTPHPASVGMFPGTGKAASPCGSLVLSAGKWRAHSGFLLLFPSHTGLLWSRQGRSHPGEGGRESLLSWEAAAGTTLPLLPRGQLHRRAQGTFVASALAGLGQGGGTRTTVQQRVPMARAVPGIRAGSSAPRPWVWTPTATHKPLLRGLGSVCWGGVSLQSKLLSRAVNMQPARHREQCEHGGRHRPGQ